MRIAILGARGQVGRIITQRLQAEIGFELILLSRKSQADKNFIQFNTEHNDWKKLGKVDVLINCVGIIHESRDDEFYKVHVEVVKSILANRNRIGNPRIIHISALGANSTHPIAFLKTKGEADELMISNPDTYVLRPSIICTSENMLVQKFKWLLLMSKFLMNRPIVPKGFLKTRIQPVMPVDLADAVCKLCTNDNEDRIIDVVGKDKMSFKELFALSDGSKKIIPIEIPKSLVEPVTRNFISVWFPNLINYDQFQLLFNDNVAEPDTLESLIQREVHSTLSFWKKELKN